MTTMLRVTNLEAGYGPIQVLRGVDLYVDEAEVVVLLGANGAGKTTTIRAICQMIDTKGSVDMCGVELVGMRPEKMAGKGMAHVPQGRGTFPELTVEENLQVGAYVRKDRAAIREDIYRQHLLLAPAEAAGRGCCCSTSRRWAWRRSSSRVCSTGSAR